MGILSSIEKKYNVLSNGEKKVADFYMTFPKEAIEKTLAEISHTIECGEATIVRFCKKVGWESFKEFQLNLSVELAKEKKSVPNNFVSDIQANLIETINDTLGLIKMSELSEILIKINQAEIIYCIGVGSSALSAEICAMRFVRNGKLSYFINNTHFQAMFLNHLKPTDFVIAFSASGKSKDTISCATLAKKRGCNLLGITTSKVSPLAQISDYILLTTKRNNPMNAGSLILQINQIFVADILTTGQSLNDEEKTLRMKELTYRSILDKIL